MSPVKGESSSHYKGKKVATNDPPTKTVGGEAPHSKSDHFKEEEGGHDPDSECPPLIYQWYDTQIHFPVVSNDYSPPPPGRVWLSLCHRDSEVPLASSILSLDIHQGTSLPVPILFEFGSSTSLGWKEWVDMKLSNVGFMVAL